MTLHSPARVLVTVAFAIVSASPEAFAQRGQTSAITGVVADQSAARVAGVRVTASSPRLIGGLVVTTTNDDGVYRFVELLPGEYEVRVEHPGFSRATRKGIELAPGGTLTIDWVLEVAATEGLVEIHAPSPMVDVRSSAAPNRLTANLLEHLPVTRTIAGLANLTPGTVAEVPLGASASAIAASFDGSPGSTVWGGGPSVFPIYHSMEEVQVIATGAGAEYGETTGIQSNVVMRSGGNAVSALGEVRGRRANWIANNRETLAPNLQQRFRPTELLVDWDVSASVGGPVMKDRLWYFGAYQQLREDTRPAGWMNVPRRPGEPAASTRDVRAIGKMTAALSPRLRAEGFFQRNAQRQHAFNSNPLTEDAALGELREVQHLWNGRLLWTPASNTVVTLMHGGHVDDYYEGPTAPLTVAGPPPRYDTVTFVSSGNYVWFTDSRARPTKTTGSITRFIDGRVGVSHELKAGFEYRTASARDSYGYPGGMWFYDAAGVPQEVYIFPEAIARSRHRVMSWFAQDRWQVADRLTIEPGIRMAANRGSVHERGTVFSTTPVSPRIGVAWDVTSGHLTVVRAHYGRYHDALLTNHYGFMDSLSSPLSSYALVTSSGSFDIISTSGGPANQAIDSNLSHSFVDAYLLGVEQQVFGDVSLRAQYLQREYDNFLAFIDPLAVYQPVLRPDPGPDGRLGTADDRGTITVYDRQNTAPTPKLMANVDEAYRRYKAVQIIGTKRFSHRWELQASYTWSRARGNVDNLINTNAAGNGLGPNGIFADPNRFINMTGTPSHDYPHQATVLGTLRLPWWGGFTVGGVHRYYSGRAWGRTINLGGLRQGNVTVRVEPFGTYRMPATNQLDLRVEKTWRAPGVRSFGIAAEVLNVNNQGTSRNVTQASGPNFGLPGLWTVPRSLRAGGRMTF